MTEPTKRLSAPRLKEACSNVAQCGGNGSPGVQRRTWYVLGKYFISDGPLQNFEPVVMYEQFDPSTTMSNDMYTRAIVGFNYYFENLPPKIQSKISINYEFRHHQGNWPWYYGPRNRCLRTECLSGSISGPLPVDGF